MRFDSVERGDDLIGGAYAALDNTSAINSAIKNAAIAGGGAVTLASGTYYLSSIIPESNVTLSGEAGTRIIVNSDPLILEHSITDFTLKGICFESPSGYSRYAYLSTVRFSGTNITVTDCEFNNIGLVAEDVTGLTVINNYFHGQARDGVYPHGRDVNGIRTDGHNILIKDNQFRHLRGRDYGWGSF